MRKAILAGVAGAAIVALATGSLAARVLLGSDGDAASSRVHRVDMSDFAFSPARLAVAIGDTIVWVNRDVAPHTATSTRGGWGSGDMPTGTSWTWIAVEPGEHDYVCAYHPSMRGVVAVSGS